MESLNNIFFKYQSCIEHNVKLSICQIFQGGLYKTRKMWGKLHNEELHNMSLTHSPRSLMQHKTVHNLSLI
jgi:hypothetical protein